MTIAERRNLARPYDRGVVPGDGREFDAVRIGVNDARAADARRPQTEVPESHHVLYVPLAVQSARRYRRGSPPAEDLDVELSDVFARSARHRPWGRQPVGPTSPR